MSYIEHLMQQLTQYKPPLTKKSDFDDFWALTKKEAYSIPLNPTKTRINYPIPNVHVYDISYNGMDHTPIHGWFLVPANSHKDKYPCIIRYHGFGGNRGEPHQFLHWVMSGFAVLSVDCRDQGGKTGNTANYTSGFAVNVASKGVHNKFEYYYRYAYMDSVKAIDFACAQEEIDPSKIILEGRSQGGALGMAAAALDDRPQLAMVDVPSNSDLVSRIEGCHGAFASVAEYLKKRPDETDLVLGNLSYFDTMNMADQIRCRVFASVGMKDDTCPPKMYFATYNRITSEKDIVIYPFNGHEGGDVKHTEKKLLFIKDHFSDWIN